MSKQGYEKKEELFLEECLKVPPDYHVLETMLNDGVDINAESSKDYDPLSLLGNVISDFGFFTYCEIGGNCEPRNCDIECIECEHYMTNRFDAGEELLKLVRFFINNGFDVKKYGDECLSWLCYLAPEGWIFRIAEELIDNGAIVDGAEDGEFEDNAIGTAEWRLGNWMTGDYDVANLMCAYYEFLDLAGKGKDYHGVRAFDECIGHRIRKVEKCIYKETPKCVLENDCYNDDLIIWCDDLPLYVHKCPELYVYPQAMDTSVETIDVSDYYREIIGLSVKQLLFIDAVTALIRFDDSDMELLLYYIDQPKKKDTFLFTQMITGEDYSLPEKDVEALYFQSGRSYSDEVTVFGEERIILDCIDSVYLLFSEGEDYQDHILRSIKVDRRVCQGRVRKADLKRITDGVSFYGADDSLVALSFRMDLLYLHIVADNGSDLNICLAKNDIDGKQPYYSFNDYYMGFSFEELILPERR